MTLTYTKLSSAFPTITSCKSDETDGDFENWQSKCFVPSNSYQRGNNTFYCLGEVDLFRIGLKPLDRASVDML